MPLQSLKVLFILKQDLINFAQVGPKSFSLSLLSVGMTGLCLPSCLVRGHLSAANTAQAISACVPHGWTIIGSLGVNNSRRIE